MYIVCVPLQAKLPNLKDVDVRYTEAWWSAKLSAAPLHAETHKHDHTQTHTLHRRHHYTRNPNITRPEDHPVWLDACYEEEPSPVSSPIPQSDTVTGKELCETHRSSYLEGPCCFFVFLQTTSENERTRCTEILEPCSLCPYPLPRPFIRSLSVFIITLVFFPLCVCTS